MCVFFCYKTGSNAFFAHLFTQPANGTHGRKSAESGMREENNRESVHFAYGKIYGHTNGLCDKTNGVAIEKGYSEYQLPMVECEL